MADDVVVACSLDRGELAERGKRWDGIAEQAFVERVLTERGLRLVFRREAGVEDELRELAELERECCAFADWTVMTDDERAVLEVTGANAQAVAAVQAMFAGGD
jgi:hypothetical protein